MAREQPDHRRGNAAIANQEHIAVLELGNSAWHKWRKDNPDVIPQLGGAELDKMGLSGVDLHDADLCGASLKLTDLRKANLRNADLTGADLREADVRGADLTDAVLLKADLRSTDFENQFWRRQSLPKRTWVELILTKWT